MAGIASKRKLNTRSIKYKYNANLDQAVFKWLLVVRSRDVAVSALFFKTKAIEFAEKMNVETSKRLMAG